MIQKNFIYTKFFSVLYKPLQIIFLVSGLKHLFLKKLYSFNENTLHFVNTNNNSEHNNSGVPTELFI